MPLCGFNQQMLEGLNAFHEGLVESVIENQKIEENKEKTISEKK